jgi:hypothetical protein
MSKISGFRKLTKREDIQLSKFNKLTYSEKEKIRLGDPNKYQSLISLVEQHNENQVIISHKQYRKSIDNYNHNIVKSINPIFFITIKYIDGAAIDVNRVGKAFENIKYELTRSNNYKFIHYIEKGKDGTYHSHIFISGIKGKHKNLQLKHLEATIKNYQRLNKFSISNADSSIDVRLFNDEIFNHDNKFTTKSRSNYCTKQVTKQYLSLDIQNSDINYAN